MSTFSEPVQMIACPHLALFQASGTDTHTFLQSQLTQDMQTITPMHSGLAGYCTAQGRLWASMLLLGNEDGGVTGLVRADVIQSFLKRLRMFVLRSKVTFETDTPNKVFGMVLRQADQAALSDAFGSELPSSDWSATVTPFGSVIAIPSPDDGYRRFYLIASEEQHTRIVDALADHAQVIDDANHWQALDLRAGIGWIEAATQDLFIAQTLNLDLLEGVSFTKGCYPGQEVVARAHYRGTVKRRMHLARLDATLDALTAGADVFEAGEPDNPIGRLINVVSQNDHALALFEAPFKAIEKATDKAVIKKASDQEGQTSLRVGSAEGPALVLQSLPYRLESAKTQL